MGFNFFLQRQEGGGGMRELLIYYPYLSMLMKLLSVDW